MSNDDYKYPHSLKSLDVMSERPAAPVVSEPVTDVAKSIKELGTGERVLTDIERKLIEGKVIAAIRTVYDPEIPVNIHDLGLIYEIDVKPDATVKVKMTLTAPGCPVAGS